MVILNGIFVQRTTPVGQSFAFWCALAYLWIMMILLGAVVLESFIRVGASDDFFPQFGFVARLLAAGTIALGWRTRDARAWLLLSVAMIVVDAAISITYPLHWLRLATTASSAVAIFVGFLRLYRVQLLPHRTWS